MKTVHCIGDSHASIFNGKDGTISQAGNFPFSEDCLPNFRTYNIGGGLAYNVGNPDHRWNIVVNKIINDCVNKDDYILLSFGQVDTAVHILKQSQIQDRPIEELSIECAIKYFEFAKTLIGRCYKIILYGPVTAGNMVVTDYPFGDKLIAAKFFTNKLVELSKNNYNVLSLPLYNKIIDAQNTTRVRAELFFDQTHLSKTFLPTVFEELREMGIMS